jgi:hypothetical protein
MAITNTFTEFKWSTAATKALTFGTNSTSDALGAPAQNAIAAQVQCKANNGGTPASGDTVDFFLLPTLGDVDGDSTTDYDTAKNAPVFLVRLDTFLENPAVGTVPVSAAMANCKIYAVNNSAARTITVSAGLLEKDA